MTGTSAELPISSAGFAPANSPSSNDWNWPNVPICLKIQDDCNVHKSRLHWNPFFADSVFE